MKTKKSIRLSPHIRPEHYLLTIKPDLDAFVFTGEEIITLTLAQPAKEITLHSKEIDIEIAEFIKDGVKTFAQKISYDTKTETATLRFPSALAKGSGQLRLVFRGILNDKMRGFYKSSYTHGGKEHHMATTQFEATDARRAFPCFDEPAHKAIFEVNLVVPENLTAISNTLPTAIDEHEAGFKIVRFAPSPKMSTYLLAFIVGDFESVEKKTKDGILVRILATPGKKHQAEFALDCAVRCLDFYNTYFDIPYPLNTLDMIAIPDFTSAAMENWGAITYRERFILIDEKNSSTITKQFVALVIAHEIAHQWFGNLVTMEWWTHLWLNEGFASYIEYLATDHLFPEWHIWDQFVASSHPSLGEALELDALGNTHPIEIEVNHPDEIGEIFDAVSYSKGAAVIRMLAAYLGEKDFRDGLRYYLKKHSYANASTIDLWKAFEQVSKKPVEKMMKVWTGKSGYPLVKVSENGAEYSLQQSRFFISPLSKKSIKDTTLWPTPLSIKGSTDETKIVLTRKTEKIKLDKDAWYKFNKDETTMARIAYSEEMLLRLREPITTKELSTADRLGVIRDLAALAEAGELSSTRVLRMLESYKNETEYTVWTEIIAALGGMYALLENTQDRKLFDAMAQKILAPIGADLGWEKNFGEEHAAALLRSLVLAALGKYGHEKTIAHAKKLFISIKKNKENVSPDLRGIVYSIVARYGGIKEYTVLQKMYHKETLHEEKSRILMSLGGFRQKSLLAKTLAFSLSKSVRSQDTPAVIASVIRNREGKELAWKFIQKQWPTLLSRYGEGGHMLSRLVESTAVFNDKKYADEIKSFFKKHPAPGAERTTRQVLETILTRALWKKRDQEAISTWLKMNR